MLSQPEVLKWVQTIPPDHYIAVDDSGLALVTLEPTTSTLSGVSRVDAYLELGGEPDEKGCEDFPVSSWVKAVKNSTTYLGYHDWVEHMRES